MCVCFSLRCTDDKTWTFVRCRTFLRHSLELQLCDSKHTCEGVIAVIWWHCQIILIFVVLSPEHSWEHSSLLFLHSWEHSPSFLRTFFLYDFCFSFFKTYVGLLSSVIEHSFCCLAFPWHIDCFPFSDILQMYLFMFFLVRQRELFVLAFNVVNVVA